MKFVFGQVVKNKYIRYSYSVKSFQKGILICRPANNSHLSGIPAEFTKNFCEIQRFRFNFPYDLRKNIACFTSSLAENVGKFGNM